ncbi:MAG: glutathione S-transferase family protein [Alphaproteobacteria bacterium]|nr:glutathione S-transferase family protein [Alphaproteobacteria bacterium]
MKLYTQRVAPNPTKLDLYLAEKAAQGRDIPLERVLVNLIKGEQHSPAIAAKNPLRRVPFLELDDGTILPESLAIIEYFEECWPEPSLIGSTPQERASTRALERGIDIEILYGVALIVHSTNSPAGYPKNPGVAAWFAASMNTPLTVLNQRLSDGRPFVAGTKPTIADCSLGAALQFARFGKLELLGPYDHIDAWDRRYRQRDEVRSVFVV